MKKKLIIITIILALFSGALGVTTFFVSRFALIEMFFSLASSSDIMPDANVLVLGVDDAYGHRSDTIMILHNDRANKSTALLSLPRDTMVNVPDHGITKINHAFAYGGIELARTTIEQFLGIKLPYYIIVNLAGIENIIDQLGGIEIDVDKRMYYADFSAGLHIDLQPGLQTLNGRQALGYLRFRHDDGDLSRINRQQNFVGALANKLMAKENVLISPKVMFSLLSQVDTNMQGKEITNLSLGLRAALEQGKVSMKTMPGHDLMVDGIYYWQPDLSALSQLTTNFQGKENSLISAPDVIINLSE